MKQPPTPWRSILVFVLITFGLSAVLDVIIASQGTLSSFGGLFSLLLMWCPAAAAAACAADRPHTRTGDHQATLGLLLTWRLATSSPSGMGWLPTVSSGCPASCLSRIRSPPN